MGNEQLPAYFNLPSAEEVIQRITDRWAVRRETEVLPVDHALGRIPAADVSSKVTLPVVRASGGDGIAVSASRFSRGMPDTSSWVLGWDFVRADTGDDFEDAYDAVIMVEDVDLSKDGKLRIHENITSVTAGMNVRWAGSTVSAGVPLVRAGLPLLPKDLAALQMGGIREIRVFKKPVVAFIPTGYELVSPGSPVLRGNNIDVNSILVCETLRRFGAKPLCYPIVPDEYADLDRALLKALGEADIIVINGGASKGDEDFTASLLHRRGEVLCHGVRTAPGRPLCAAMVEGKPVINLPGPFLAAYHGLEWCVSAVVSYYLKQPVPKRQTVKAVLTRPLPGGDTVSVFSFIAVTRKKDGSGFWATPLSPQPLWKCIMANGQYTAQPGETVPEGGEIEVELLRGPEYIPESEK